MSDDDEVAQFIEMPFKAIERIANRVEERAVQVDRSIRRLQARTREMDERLSLPLNSSDPLPPDIDRENQAKSAENLSGMKDELLQAADLLEQAARNSSCNWCTRKAVDLRSAVLGLANVQEEAAVLADKIDKQAAELANVDLIRNEIEHIKQLAARENELTHDITEPDSVEQEVAPDVEEA
jgi:vacuolar-type H+-ATPase subunit I/STV1|tara:strand:+ start:111 stop:656 length:546 start_codon:yes stop_codon:yes gene_type:complete